MKHLEETDKRQQKEDAQSSKNSIMEPLSGFSLDSMFYPNARKTLKSCFIQHK